MPQLVDIVGGLKMTQDAVNERLADLKHKHDNDQYYFQAVIENAKTERDKLERCMSAAYEDKLDSVSLLEQYDGASKTLQAEMEGLDSEYLLKLSDFAPVLFKSSNPTLENKLLKILLSNLEIKKNHLSYKRWQPFDALASCLETQNWLSLQVTDSAVIIKV